ncbi:phosphomannomutase/phosphomannomutase/phosphoglucomutase [Fluviicoccus keumensis]|uniref:phosphomannomutase n=1 Tax=Fluviicoccus keumensis TaxID=1435465 RepID=A0A4Q7ZAE8_9GAMM|nr:phosphomannomutase [Fluviicoccus keumensis]RZU46853.1 phosphomannomutase/phosphomannomutase/phosphoglucomutase [Fluviicoccus keumensis]
MNAEAKLSAFKAYDVRGRVPDQLNERTVQEIGRAYARVIKPEGAVAVGRDIRETSDAFACALIAGLNAEGCRTVDIGLCGTEMVYYAAGQAGMGGGIMVTASHNPSDYNGLKMVRSGARPISSDSGLTEIEQETRRLLAGPASTLAVNPDLHRQESVLQPYVSLLLGMINPAAIKPLHLVVNAGNGCAGPVFDALAAHLPIRVTRLCHEPDGTFPNDVPNPMLIEQQQFTARAVIEHGADLGLAWDGDFDRCFFFDETGQFIEGYYLVGLLAEQLLKKAPGSTVIYDPRLTWNTVQLVEAFGGKPVISKCGHSFIKDKMREQDAVYGGEMSAHHYFRDFFYCDSGMIPWLLMLEQLSESGAKFSQVVESCMREFPCSGEINFTIKSAAEALQRVRAFYEGSAVTISTLDGLTMEFAQWRFNLRSSNTEPVVRLNVESRGDKTLLAAKTAELKELITA